MEKPELRGRDVLWRAVRGQRRSVALGVLLGACHQGGEAVVPVLIRTGRRSGSRRGGCRWSDAVARRARRRLRRALLQFPVRRPGGRTRLVDGRPSAPRRSRRARPRTRRRRRGRPVAGRTGELANIATEDAKRVGAVSMAVRRRPSVSRAARSTPTVSRRPCCRRPRCGPGRSAARSSPTGRHVRPGRTPPPERACRRRRGSAGVRRAARSPSRCVRGGLP